MSSTSKTLAAVRSSLGLPAADTASELFRGRTLRHTLNGTRHGYWLYHSAYAAENAPVLVVVHGISRNAHDQICLFRKWADRYGLVLVAPIFSEHTFPGYQRLEEKPSHDSSVRVLQSILNEVALRDVRTRRPYFFGFSGGAQFVHRYAMAFPSQVAAVALGAPGWYTYPDPTLPYPLGLKNASGRVGGSFAPQEFLRVPTLVIVGDRDVERDASLNTLPKIDRQQGRERVERGRRWIEAMQAAAERHAVPARFEYHLLPNAGHSFQGCVRSGLAKIVSQFLFELS